MAAVCKQHGWKRSVINETLFVVDSDSTRAVIRRRVIQDGLINYTCSICQNSGAHNGQPLTLQLDHINGVNNDNRLENLRFLCPNCHSQTPTYSNKIRIN